MITKIRLKNFKSFREAEVPLAPFTIIIGANGAGKSNFFDALRFLRAIGQGRSVREALEGRILTGPALSVVDGVRGGAGASIYFGSKSREFTIEAEISTSGHHLYYSVTVDVVRQRVVAESLRSDERGGPYIFSTHPETGPLNNDPDSPVIRARFYKEQRGINPKRDFAPWDFILTQFTGRKAESNDNDEAASLVRGEFAAVSPFELRPEVLRTYSTLGGAGLGEHGENFAGAVADLLSRMSDEPNSRTVTPGDRTVARDRYRALLSWVNTVTPRGVTAIETLSAPTGEVVFGIRELPFDRVITAPSLSDGTLRFAALAFAALDPSPGQRTLVVEEIENGVNPSRLPYLVQMLSQAVEADTRTQIIASTHSASVLDATPQNVIQDAVAIGWDDDAAGSTVRRFSDLPAFEEARQTATLGELQTEGWFNAAAGA